MPTVVCLDLNGTLADPIRRPGDAPLRPLPGALDALALLHQADFACVVTTVQGRIGRGLFSEDDFRAWFGDFAQQVEKTGGKINGLYLCPHSEAAGCQCRKPGTALYDQVGHDLGADMSRSWIVGDTSNDLGAAARLGARAILVRTGYGQRAQSDPTAREAVVDCVLDAAHYIRAVAVDGPLSSCR